MMQVTKDVDIYTCQSCYKNKKDNNVDVYIISIG